MIHPTFISTSIIGQDTIMRFITIAIPCLSVLMLAGCAGRKIPTNAKINQWLARSEHQLPTPVYRVEPPDTIQIIAPQIRELNGLKQTVRPDGRISVNLLGDVLVAGKTPRQIANELRERASRFYDPKVLDISVQVVEFKSKMIYVFGQVEQPGIKPFTGRQTLLQILAESRLNQNAWPEKIVVVRPHDDPSIRQKVTLDVKTMYETGNTDRDYLLESGDIVYVPPSPLAQLGATFTRLTVPLESVMNLAGLAATGGF